MEEEGRTYGGLMWPFRLHMFPDALMSLNYE
jgi:hypothetical protein